MTTAQAKHCETCKCGLTLVEWSDRETWVDETDTEAIADLVECWTEDHAYDRHERLPWILKSRDVLQPLVERYLDARWPDWREKTIDMDDEQREALRALVIAALTQSEQKDAAMVDTAHFLDSAH